jgi:alkanesulfonate monooxygenase SsuD/methylene tetrahydromethanopterin reductase-like flavin-dependent oxidoreductase (luciferase family)
LVLGLGCGYQPYEFSRFNVDPASKHKIMMETWDILEQGLVHGTIDYDGEMFKIPPTELPMRPFGLGFPRTFVASFNPDVVARTAREGHTPFMSFGLRGIGEAVASRAVLENAWRAAVEGSDTMPLAVQRYVYITENKDDARHAAACVRNLARANRTLTTPSVDKEGPFLRLMPFHDEPPLDDFLDQSVIGSPEDCAEKLAAEIDALRPTHLSCFMGFAGIGRRETLASMERFGSEVLPILASRVTVGTLAHAA